jgi:hypothetical protein
MSLILRFCVTYSGTDLINSEILHSWTPHKNRLRIAHGDSSRAICVVERASALRVAGRYPAGFPLAPELHAGKDWSQWLGAETNVE